MPRLLTHAELADVVRLAPLVAIDLIIRNPRGEVLLGHRNNAPARGFFFVPGGIILKDERMSDAFARILKRETNLAGRIDEARPLGAFEHFYDDNRFGEAGYGTHYIVLGYELSGLDLSPLKADSQHSELRFWPLAELLASEQVHDNAKAYFRARG